MASLYGLLSYQAWPEYNVGDYIQSLAAARFLPRIDTYINREKLNRYTGPPVKLIMNGWFMHNPSNWPPSEKIEPLLTSFHLNCQVKDSVLTKEGISWIKKHEPVGCRDEYTLDLMKASGIECYLSGCLTTTFENTYNYRTNDIYFSDVLFRVPGWSTSARTPREFVKSILTGDIARVKTRNRLLNELFSESLISSAKTLSHYHTARHSEKERFDLAEHFLEKFATAKLVVTSRLHCALPCLAFGTPVIFIHCGFREEYDQCRLKGVTDLFNTIYIGDDGTLSSNFGMNNTKISEDFELANPSGFRSFVPILRTACKNFVEEVPVHQL
jgi:hypothetical protein